MLYEHWFVYKREEGYMCRWYAYSEGKSPYYGSSSRDKQHLIDNVRNSVEVTLRDGIMLELFCWVT